MPPQSHAARTLIHDQPLQLPKIEKGSDAMTYGAVLNGFETVSEFDPGASHQYISAQAAAFCSLYVTACIQELVQLGNASFKPFLGKTTARLSIKGKTWLKQLYIIDIQQ